jgi:tetraacyldisaccharide 4'-kinase
MGLTSFLTRALLSVPAGGYYAVQKTREKAYYCGWLAQRSAPVPVISVGNLLLGGSGKTPFVIYLAEMLHRLGARPAVVSRGYRGLYMAPYMVVSEGKGAGPLVDSLTSGDEPFLIAERIPHVPVLVGRKRIVPVEAAVRLFDVDAVILDDGFQHLQLKRDLDIALINGAEDRMFPLGMLREPISALSRASMIVLVGDSAKLHPKAAPYVSALPCFRCKIAPVGLETHTGSAPPTDLAGKDVVLTSAIANPQRFRQTALDLGWRVVDHFTFPDHHRLTSVEIDRILSRRGSAYIVVTEKDWVKLPDRFKEMDRVARLNVSAVVDDEDAFRRALTFLSSVAGRRDNLTST